MSWPGRCLDVLFAIYVENSLFLPVLDYPCLSRDDIEYFLDLGEKSLAGTGLLFVAQRYIDPYPWQFIGEAFALFARWFSGRIVRQLVFDITERDFQFGLVKEVPLERQLLTTAAKALQFGQAQFLFQ